MFTAIQIVSFPQVLSYVRRFIAIPNKMEVTANGILLQCSRLWKFNLKIPQQCLITESSYTNNPGTTFSKGLFLSV